MEYLGPELDPRQIGVGVRGGAEAVVHAAQVFVSSASSCHALIKPDMVNAFNTVRRDSIFELAKFPNFSLMYYHHMSYLLLCPMGLLSWEGLQQGDPASENGQAEQQWTQWGPLLFSLTILYSNICRSNICHFPINGNDTIIQ